MTKRLVIKTGSKLPPATWLVDWDGAERGKQGAIKYSVLEQIGRLSEAGFSEQQIREAVAVLELKRWTAKEAAERMRRWRLQN